VDATAQDMISADLDVIDAALDRLRARSTDRVGTAFRITVAERLETHNRVNSKPTTGSTSPPQVNRIHHPE
jgi:hypothetical protein